MIRQFFFLLFLLYLIRGECGPSCEVCNNVLNSCLICKEGTVKNFANQCTESIVKHCDLVDMDGKCFGCQQLYKFENGECVRDQTGCISNDFQSSKCNECLFGTKLKDNKCQGVLNCGAYSNDNQCSECFQGYMLMGNICLDFSAGCMQF